MKQLALCMLVLTLLIGCGHATQKTETTQSVTTTETITYSSNIIEGILSLMAEDGNQYTAQDLVDGMESKGIDAIANEDGSVTITVTQKQLNELKSEYKKALDELIQQWSELEDSGISITNIVYNDDLSHFDVTIKGDQLTFMDNFTVIVFYMYGTLYGVLTDVESPIVTVDFINSNGEVVSSTSSADMDE